MTTIPLSQRWLLSYSPPHIWSISELFDSTFKIYVLISISESTTSTSTIVIQATGLLSRLLADLPASVLDPLMVYSPHCILNNLFRIPVIPKLTPSSSFHFTQSRSQIPTNKDYRIPTQFVPTCLLLTLNFLFYYSPTPPLTLTNHIAFLMIPGLSPLCLLFPCLEWSFLRYFFGFCPPHLLQVLPKMLFSLTLLWTILNRGFRGSNLFPTLSHNLDFSFSLFFFIAFTTIWYATHFIDVCPPSNRNTNSPKAENFVCFVNWCCRDPEQSLVCNRHSTNIFGIYCTEIRIGYRDTNS